MSNAELPEVFVLESEPGWGFAIALEERNDNLTLLFERGGERLYKKSRIRGLKPAELSTEEARAVEAGLRGRKRKVTGSKSKTAKKKVVPRLAPKFATFDDQVRWFDAHFPGGFEGDRFQTEERGLPGAKGKKGHKTAAIDIAQKQLSLSRFEQDEVEVVFEAARKVAQLTNIVHPMEGGIALGAMKPEDRAPFVAALKDLLHGEGDHAARFDAFVEAVRIADAEGKPKKVTWPLATVIAAMVHPTEQVAIKPTCFEAQGPLVGIEVDRSQPVNGAAYALFLQVAKATQAKLLEAGQAPRDLMDVYSFIWSSQSAKA